MIKLSGITNVAYQKLTVVTESGIPCLLTLKWNPTTWSWNADLFYLDFTLKGIALTNFPNVLRAYRHIIPIGIMCYSANGYDPQTVDAFSSGDTILYLLNEDDIIQIEDLLLKK